MTATQPAERKPALPSSPTHQKSPSASREECSASAHQHEFAEAVAASWLLPFKASTTTAYGRDLRDFFAYCEDMGIDPLAAKRPQIEKYGHYLVTERDLAPSTLARRYSSIAGFFRYALLEELISRDPMTGVRRPIVHHEAPPQTLDRSDMVALLGAGRVHSPRANALCCLLLLNGLRISEICLSNVGDLARERGHNVLRVHRKGGKVSRIPLADVTHGALCDYLNGRRRGPLLLSRTGQRLDRTNAGRLLSAVADLAFPGERRSVYPHLCRHAAITAALDAGVPLRDVQDAAGHASADTTRRYDDARHALERNPTYGLAKWLLEDNVGPTDGARSDPVGR